MADEVSSAASGDSKREESFMDPSQLDLYKLLARIAGDGPAATYRDACRLMASDPPFENESHMLAHLLRELESAMRRICMSPIPKLPQEPKKKGEKEKKDTHKREIQHILHEYELKEDEPVGAFWLSLTEEDRRLSSRVHRNAISRPRPLDSQMQSVWREFQDFLRIIARKLEHRYGLFVGQIADMLKRDVPTKEDLALITNAIPNSPVLLEHFFKTLQHPGWLLPLRDEGFFLDPPEPTADGRSRYWPQVVYLVQMAKVENIQGEVASILLQIAGTQNVAVIRGIIDAAVQIPAAKITALVPSVQKWMQTSGAVMVHYKLDDLLLHLAKGGCAPEALEVARILLAIAPQTAEQRKVHDEPQSVIDRHVYTEMTSKAMPPLVQIAGFPAFELLCDTLVTALEQTLLKYRNAEPYKDHSKIWRHSISGEERHHSPEVCNDLISAVRKAAVALAESNPSQLPALIAALEERKWTALRRIALFLLETAKNPSRDLIAQRLGDVALLEDDDIRREYDSLAETHAQLLTTAELDVVLKHIEAGPDIVHRKEAHRTFWGKELTEDELKQYVDYWQLENLFPFRKVLQGSWKAKYDDLVKRYGEPKDEQPSRFAAHVGEKSPLTEEQLRAMQLDELIKNLQNWKPTNEWDAPTPRGLGHAVEALVAKDPVYYAENALKFSGLEATYVRSLFDGFQKAAKEGKVFPWEKVLQLADWVLTLPVEIPGRDPNSFDIDPSWNWTRMQIARLMRDSLGDEATDIPFVYRKQAWEIIESLNKDPEPSVEYEKEYGGDNMDPHHLAINTVRGTAIELAIFYALWVFRNKGIKIDDALRKTGSFGEMPEVRQVLDEHLDPAKDPSLAVRSMYGLHFPQLHLLDRPWARDAAGRIFPNDEDNRALHDAAWNTFVLNPAYDTVFEGLKQQYEHAIELMGSPSPIKSRQMREPDEHLAGHLMALYFSGDIPLDDSILQNFFEKASDELRGTALGYVGQILKNEKPGKVIKPEELQRAIELWDSRLQVAKSNKDGRSFAPEMMSFAWWFLSEKFDDKWSLEKLKEALTLGQDIEVDHMVVERLVKLTAAYPLLCVECLQLIAEGKDSAGWGIQGYMEEAQVILRTALASSNLEAQRKADALRNSFIARGHVNEFQNLG